MNSLRGRLDLGEILLLDAALGTELERRGADTRAPLWSARSLLEREDLVLRIHADDAAAGADILTAATFRTHPRNLVAGGFRSEVSASEAALLTTKAIRIAREGGRLGRPYSGVPGRPVLVAGSLSPLEDCYRPDLCPETEPLAQEHKAQALRLARAGSDLIVVETMNSRAEALAAASAASHTRLPTIVAFVTDGRGSLLSGDPLSETALAVANEAGPQLLAIGVNCVPYRLIESELRRIRSILPGVPLAAWANTGRPLAENPNLTSDPISPDDYAEQAEIWIGIGAQVVGGCCGTTSAHTEAVRRLIDRRRGARRSSI